MDAWRSGKESSLTHPLTPMVSLCHSVTSPTVRGLPPSLDGAGLALTSPWPPRRTRPLPRPPQLRCSGGRGRSGMGGGAAGPGGGGGRGATTSARSKAAEAFVGRNTRVGRRRRLAGRRLFLRRGVPLHLRGGGNKASHWQQLTSSLWRNWHLAQ